MNVNTLVLEAAWITENFGLIISHLLTSTTNIKMRNLRVFQATTFLFAVACVAGSSVSPITLDSNGYTGVLVAISKKVPEDKNILKNIEAMFNEASPALYEATGNRAYFKEVTIAIPDTWSYQAEYENVSGDFLSKAHVRIDLPNPAYGFKPYTLQVGACGTPGQYVHYTPEYILDPDIQLDQDLFRQNEKPGYRLVQEWSKFRYGVFDEFGYVGSFEFRTYYYDNKDATIRPTGCTKNIQGSPDYSDICKVNFNEGESSLDDLVNCSSIPNDPDLETASIMYTASLDQVVHFCQSEETDNGRQHNADAPNRQNKECNFQSTWDIVSSHPDMISTTVGADDVDTKPKFRYIRSPGSDENRLVLVLDTSNSMKGRPIQLLIAAASRCIKDHIPNGNELGLVSFSTSAVILANLTKIQSARDRDRLVSFLPKREDDGYTAIGKGLLKAVNILEGRDKAKAEGGRIILVTDGEENINPKIDVVLPILMSKKVVISAVAFGHKASEKLENLTASTGGKLYLFSKLEGSTSPSSLDFAFLEATTTQTDIDIQPVTIANERTNPSNKTLIREINIERQLGKNTVFTIQSTQLNYLEMSLRRPNGTLITDKNADVFELDKSTQRARFIVPKAESGMWNIEVTSSFPVVPPLDVMVRSSPVEPRSQPVRVKAWISDIQLTFPAILTIFAEVKKEYIPVIKANVTAKITRPNGLDVDVVLKDDGATPDLEKDDGIYTAYFTEFSGSGRYGVIAKVVNDGRANLKFPDKENVRPKRSIHALRDVADDTNPDLDNFERVADGGVFKLDNWYSVDKDVIPPSRITDLEIIATENFAGSEKVVILRWTSPGDDLNSGNASYLEVRYSNEIKNLRKNFEQCELVSESLLLDGDLTPVPAGIHQKVKVRVVVEAQRNSTNEKQASVSAVYFAVVARDEQNNTGEISNIGYAYFESGRKEPIEAGEELDYYLIATCVAVSLFALTIVGLLVAIVMKVRRTYIYHGIANKVNV